MRITNNMMLANMTSNLQASIRKLDKTQMQYYTGKRIHKPSDDPVGITRSLKIRADIRELEQYKKNVEDALSWLENTEQAVAGISGKEALIRLKELMVQGANGVLANEETIKVRNEVAEIKNQIISLANTTYSGDFVFSGKKADEKLLNHDGTYNIDIMQFLDSNIVDHRINYEIGVGEYIPINTVGTTLFEAVDLTMSVQLPEKDGPENATKMEFLGAEISITRKDIKDENDETSIVYELEIKIGDDIILKLDDSNDDNKAIDAILIGSEEDENIDEVATKAEIYKKISDAFEGVKDDPDKVEAWNKLLIEKNIPADINNLTFGTYENNGQAVGIVAKPTKAGLINLIEKIEKNLIEGNYEEVSELLGPLDRFMDKILAVRGEIGAKVNRAKSVFNRIEDDIINLRELQSKLEDTSIGEMAIQLMNEENVYRAALQVGARIIQPTLLDFLR